MACPVMCVDDERDILAILRDTAEAAGFEVVASTTTASNLRELLVQWNPRVVILDHNLDSRRWGLEVVDQIRWTAPDAVVAVFTGRPGLEQACRNAGCHVHVEKPDIATLWQKIREELDARGFLDLRDPAEVQK